jgi:hypothetical protein
MSVVVDDAGSDHQAVRIQDLARLSVHFSDLDDTTAADGDVAVEAWQAGTVNHLAVLDNQIVWHCSSYAAGKRRVHAPGPAAADRLRVWTVVSQQKYSMTHFLSINEATSRPGY